MGKYQVYNHCNKKTIKKPYLEYIKYVETLGAGEILLTSMDCDGTKSGYDIDLTRVVADAVSVPVIASGGAGKTAHLYEVLSAGGADAALAASIFHYRELSITDVKKELLKKGLPMRFEQPKEEK